MTAEPFGEQPPTGEPSDGNVARVRLGDVADRPSDAVVEAITRATGTPPEPGALYRAIDPDALDALFADRLDGSPRTDGALSFVVDDCVVAVRANGEVIAAALD